MTPVTESGAPKVAPQQRAPSSLERTLGPAFTFREINVVRWTLLIATALAMGLRPLYLQLLNGSFQRGFRGDFFYFYSFGRLLNDYPADRLYDFKLHMKICDALQPLNAGHWGHSPYPPFLGMLFAPLARLDFLPAYILWLAISFGLYTAGLSLVTRRFFPSNPLRRALIFCFALCFAPFLSWIMASGQVSALGFFAIALAFCMDDLERPVLSGLALSLCMYKPTLLVLLLPMLLVTKRYRTLLGLAAGAATLAALPIAFHGIGVWSGYLKTLLTFPQAARTPWFYVDLGAFASLLPSANSWEARVVFSGLAAWAGFSLFRVWWRSIGARKPSTRLLWATTLTWTLVLNVYVPVYDSILVIISVAATVAALNDLPDKRLHRMLTALWLLIFAFSWATENIAQDSGFQIMTVLLALLGILQLSAFPKIDRQTAAFGPRDNVPALLALPN